MRQVCLVFTMCVSVSIGAVFAQEPQPHVQGEIRDTIGLVSEEVAKQQLEMQGYTNVQIIKKDVSTMEFTASKENAPVVLEMNRKQGTVNDVTSFRLKPFEREGIPRIPGPTNK